MRLSNNFELNLVEGSDVVNPLVQDVPNYEKIDRVMKENQNSGISTASELLNGTVHTITRDNTNSPMFRFVATSKYTSGDTFTVDGVQVTALTTTGEALSSGAYVIGSNVLCCLTGTLLTLFVTMGGEYKAYDSDRLGGKDPSHYATQGQVSEAINIAQSANSVALETRTAINKNIGDIVYLKDVTLTYLNPTTLQVVLNDLPESVYENVHNTHVFMSLRAFKQTPYTQVWGLINDINATNKTTTLMANGTFVSGHVVTCCVMVVVNK